MGWLRLIGSLKLQVSFAKSPVNETICCKRTRLNSAKETCNLKLYVSFKIVGLFCERDYILQKKPVISRSLAIQLKKFSANEQMITILTNHLVVNILTNHLVNILTNHDIQICSCRDSVVKKVSANEQMITILTNHLLVNILTNRLVNILTNHDIQICTCRDSVVKKVSANEQMINIVTNHL